jgi:hypothetical protein
LPAGLTFNSVVGVISGTPTVLGVFSVNISAINDGGSGTATLAIAINLPIPIISSSLSDNAPLGIAYGYSITASNTPNSYGAIGLPNGLSVNLLTGSIFGIPSQLGVYSVNISATNGGGTGIASLTITVNLPIPIISSPLTYSAFMGIAFNYSIIASSSPTSYGATTLPAGLALNTATGEIYGTPSDLGVFNVNISATNDGGT